LKRTLFPVSDGPEKGVPTGFRRFLHYYR